MKMGIHIWGLLKQIMEDRKERNGKIHSKLLLKSKLHGRKKIMTINNCVSWVLRYSVWILRGNTEELKGLNKKTPKDHDNVWCTTFQKWSRYDYVSRDLQGRGLISCQGCIRIEEYYLERYVKNFV